MRFPVITIPIFMSLTALAQSPVVVELPPLTISGSTLDSAVTFDAARGVYRYSYTINAAPTNKAPIASVHIDVSGRVARAQDDPALQGNAASLVPISVQPPTTIPVKLSMPLSLGNAAFGMTNKLGEVVFGVTGAEIPPGAQSRGWAIESRFPPAIRNARLHPSVKAWNDARMPYTAPEYADKELEFRPNDASAYDVKLQTLAPSDPPDSALDSGGGQSPAVVNKFLQYTMPSDNRVNVPAGATTTTIILFYGPTTIPSTFSATVNGTSITSLFAPAPGSAQVVTIPLGPGTTKIQLSIEGTSRTATARQTVTR